MKPKSMLYLLIITLGLLLASGVQAQLNPPLPPAGFGIIGFIQEATLDGTVAGTAGSPMANTDIRAGGTITINGVKILVPNNTIVQMPAAAFSWQQLFRPAISRSIGYTPVRLNHLTNQLGLTLADGNAFTHFPSFEATVTGNIVPHPTTGAPQYIAGLIAPIAQMGLMGGFGIINYIDYDGTVLPGNIPGRFRVGGVIGDPTTGALCEINDPVGRWGAVHSPDPRFTTDTGNPTVVANNGYPVGIPRVAPTGLPGDVGDAERPYTNRPPNNPLSTDPNQPFDPFLATGAPLKTFNMPAPGGPAGTPDPTKQLPLMVGDTIDYAGALMKINQAGPNTAANTFFSLHALAAELGVFTQPGVQPCYVAVEAFLMPTAEVRNGPPAFGGNPLTSIPLENSTRAVVVGFTTDPSQFVDVYAIDVDPASGAETERLLTTVLPEPIGAGRVRGRFRFTPSRTVGIFPATREYICKSQTGQLGPVANGLTSGQYRLPCFDFLFGERLTFGNPTTPVNFDQMPFLAQGCGPITGGPVFGRLDPWPGP